MGTQPRQPREQSQRWRLLKETDVRAVLPLISCPTLVAFHRGGDVFGRAACAYLGEAIEGAQIVELPVDCMVMSWDGSPAELLSDAIEKFVAEPSAKAPPATRMLATVVFTDFVASTATARRAGDAWWLTMLVQMDATARVVTDRLGGRIVKSTGDGILAVFDAPGRAVSAATELCESATRLGLALRAGIHTGEVEMYGDDVSGLAVALAARIVEKAASSEVLVSRTVSDLTVGSLIDYDPRGEHHFKGFDRPWELFAANVT